MPSPRFIMSAKYPRTFHLPWSKGATSDDKVAQSVSSLIGQPIIITEKCDGSNTCFERDACYARTHSGPPTHPSFNAFKALHATIKHKIPENYQIFGEYMFALHSLAYDKLPGYFLVFNVHILDSDQWLSWNEVELWANELEVPTVPVLFKGTVNSEKELQNITENLAKQPSPLGSEREGIVVRLANSFHGTAFKDNVMKIVRPNHVVSSEHWAHQEIVRNKLL